MDDDLISEAYDDILAILNAEEDSFKALAERARLDYKTDFRDANLQKFCFGREDLSGFDFTGANLCGTKFLGTDLTDTNFSSACLDEVMFERAHLFKTDFTNASLHHASFNKGSLDNVSFNGCNLLNASFRDVDLNGNFFENANLTGVSFLGKNKRRDLRGGFIFISHDPIPRGIRPYFDAVLLTTRLHRLIMEAVQAELDRLGINDINSTQSMMLYKIGDDEVLVSDLLAYGHCMGGNASCSIKKMIKNGYLHKERSPWDRRVVRVSLQDRGLDLRDKLSSLFERQAEALGEVDLDDHELIEANEVMRVLVKAWPVSREDDDDRRFGQASSVA